EVGVGNTTVAAAVAAGLLSVPADDVVGRGSSADTAMVERKRDVVRRALDRVGAVAAVGPHEVVRRLGGGELAVLTGVVLGVAEAGGVVVLDGLATSVCALAAVRAEPAVAAHLVAGQRSREKAHAAVLHELGLEPLLDLRIRAGEGVGAALATGLVKDALALRRGVARTSAV
ncbi:MAG: 5,6-dimethylbenzimidazole synthase, partial [Dermatophilaceae bacterium]|nr:5,6-dimethylbenzimidazole synthase [Dermatophilaceae bacterium]